MATKTSSHLLDQAEGLLSLRPKRKPRQTELRRAISASYYAVFNFILEKAADMYVGDKHKRTVRYALAYRSVPHTWFRTLCVDLGKQSPPASLKPFLPSSGLGPDIRRFAAGVPDLQEKRHSADYDPLARFVRDDVLATIKAARSAVERFELSPLADRQLFLALLLFPPRGRA